MGQPNSREGQLNTPPSPPPSITNNHQYHVTTPPEQMAHTVKGRSIPETHWPHVAVWTAAVGRYPRVQGPGPTGTAWEGGRLPRRPKKHSMAVLPGDLKATFGTDPVCAAVQRGKTMYCESWL